MIYKLEPLDRTIASIVRALKLGDKQVNYQDFVEWIADGLEHIGCYYQLIDKAVFLPIDNYQALFPCDVYKVIKVVNSVKMDIQDTGGFYSGSAIGILEKNIPDLFVVGPDGKAPYDNMSAYERWKVLAVGGLQTSANNGHNNSSVPYNQGTFPGISATNLYGREYKIEHNRIITSYRTGFVLLEYQAFPLDDRGWPLVPDNVSYRDALFWKVIYQLSMSSPELLTNPAMRDINFTYQKWSFYCTQARAEGYAPDEAMLGRIANNWISFLGSNSFNNDFIGSGLPSNLSLNGTR